jgi:hypothetical protein
LNAAHDDQAHAAAAAAAAACLLLLPLLLLLAAAAAATTTTAAATVAPSCICLKYRLNFESSMRSFHHLINIHPFITASSSAARVLECPLKF